MPLPFFGLFKPNCQLLLALSAASPANNNGGFRYPLDWKSDLSGLWLQSMYRFTHPLSASALQLPFGQPGFGGLELWQRSLDSWMQPIADAAQKSIARDADPDLFKQQNADIEGRYALIIEALCELCFDQGRFSAELADGLFTDPSKSSRFYQLFSESAALEFSYNSLGLTRLCAQKELLTTLLMLMTQSPANGKLPYRRYDEQGQPLDSFEDYLASCQQRLENLYRQRAFDLVRFSETSPAAVIGCTAFDWVEGSAWNGVKLRFYRSIEKGADQNPVLYLNSPLINRTEIFDLAPEKSVVEALLKAGHHVYLVDFTEAGEQQTEMGLDLYGKQVHDRYLELVKQRHPDQTIQAMGYCMGGTLLLTYLARRAEECEAQGLPMDITKVVLMATPVLFDDAASGHAPMRDLIRQNYDSDLFDRLFDGANIPPQLIESGMHQIQPGVSYTVTQGFYQRAGFEGALEDAAPFLNWLFHGTRFPAKAHREWIEKVYMGNQIWEGRYCLSSKVSKLDGQPVDMNVLTRAGVQLMDYRGLRDPIAPIGSCIASETWGANPSRSDISSSLNRTIDKNIGHIFVVSRKHLAEFIDKTLAFYHDGDV